MKFRPDIEGLRALAVVPILFNHALVPGFHGGFIGVDIFFVISGYLITGILMRDMGRGEYSLAGFYRRRALRILPALFVMMLATFLVGYFAMTPNEFVGLARSAMATTFFVSNVHFFLDTGYFTSAAAHMPLLHTWSLAVEEQFYIFWPLLLAALIGAGRRRLFHVIVALSVLSLLASVWMVGRNAPAAFYLIPFRAWELGLGGILAVAQVEPGRLGAIPERYARPLRNLLALGGLAVILYCVHNYRQPIVFPGLTALPPTLATVAIIAAGPGTLVNRALSLWPARFVGRISYSLYLWHWPVIVFAQLWFFLSPTPWTIAGELALSIALAILSYELLETRLRDWLARSSTRTVLARAGVAIAALAVICLVILRANGFENRFDPGRLAIARVLDRDEEATYRRGTCFVVEAGDRFDPETCLPAKAARPSLLLTGDSVAAHYWPGLSAVAGDFGLMQATMVGCRPTVTKDPAIPCEVFFNDILEDWVPGHTPDVVMLAGNWLASDAEPLRATLERLGARKENVVVIGPMPRYESALPRLMFFSGKTDLAAASLQKDVWAVDRSIGDVARAAGVRYISPLELLCEENSCVTFAAPGIPLQFDYVHLTREGSEFVARRIMEQVRGAGVRSAKAESSG